MSAVAVAIGGSALVSSYMQSRARDRATAAQ